MIEETLQDLSKLQIEAAKKGIEFNIDLTYNSQKVPKVDVALHYTVTGGINKGYVFNTTLGESVSKTKAADRFDEIKYFISTVTGPTE